MRYRKKETFKCTQWFKVGDHPAIKKIPKYYKNFIPVKNGAMGLLDDESDFYGEPVFVYLSDWIIDRDDGYINICSDDDFKKYYEAEKLKGDRKLN